MFVQEMEYNMKFVKNSFKIIITIIIIIYFFEIFISYKLNKNKYCEFSKIYGNQDGYVPQGLAYSQKYEIILQTSYNKKKDVSMLYVINSKTGTLERKFKLLKNDGTKNYNHVGGITTDDNKVWITSDYEINEFNLEEIIKLDDQYLKSINDIKIHNRGDFCAYYDNILWIGEFFLNGVYNVKDNDPLLLGYNVENDLNYDIPDYIISIPKMVQGLAITPEKNFIFTRSYSGFLKSELVVYENILNDEYDYYNFNGKMVRHFKFNSDKKIKITKLPPMAEGLFLNDNFVYVLFESSADIYIIVYPKIDKIIKIKIY